MAFTDLILRLRFPLSEYPQEACQAGLVGSLKKVPQDDLSYGGFQQWRAPTQIRRYLKRLDS